MPRSVVASTYQAEVYPAGTNLIVHAAGARVPGVGGLRSSITKFSAASRCRLRRRLVKFDWPGLTGQGRVLWITFTALSGDVNDFKGWLDRWRKVIDRRFPVGVWFIWRLEFQRRGVAHFHLILVCPTALCASAIESQAVGLWLAAARDGAPSFSAQHVRRCGRMWGIAAYVSDMGKFAQCDNPSPGESTGRWWGVRGACSHLAVCVCSVVLSGSRPFDQVRRLVRSLRVGRGRSLPVHAAVVRVPRTKDAVEFFSTASLTGSIVSLSVLF